jgi:phosphate transport system permease protein
LIVEPISLQATGRARRRLRTNRGAEIGAILAALLAVALLAVLVGSVLVKALPALSWNLFTKGPAVFGETGGGIAPALVGTLLLIVIATAMAVPVGVSMAIYVSEFAPRRVADQIRLWLDVLNGFPSIVIGIFVFELMVQTNLPLLGIGHHQSAWAGDSHSRSSWCR